jgi:hypothetical protein
VVFPISGAYAQVQEPLFAFGDVHTGPNVTGTQIRNTTTITSHNAPVAIAWINEESQFGTEGIYNLTATSVGAATPFSARGQFMQEYTGSFSVTGDGGFNYLSATFTEPLLAIDASANVINENQAQFSRFAGEGSFHFASDISGLASTLNEDDQEIYFLAIFEATSFGITDGTLDHSQATGAAILVQRDRLW